MELFSSTNYSRRISAAALVVLVFLGTTFSVVSAQTIWKRATLPQGATLHGISIPADGNAFAAGGHGRILRSTDDGATWSALSTGLPADSTNDLLGISFGTPSVGIAVGARGTIISTGDGGVTWTKRFSEMEYDLDKPMMVGADNGFLHSPLFAVSRDGGASWSFLTQIADFSMNAFWMFDSLNGVAAAWTFPDSYHRMVRTTNAGASWQPTAFSLWESDDFFKAIAFGDDLHGCVVGTGGIIARTEDGGATWTAVSSGTTRTLNAVSFRDRFNGITVGYQGVILRTTDGGTTWSQEASGTSETLRAVEYRGPVAIVVGGESEGSILYTRDVQSSVDRDAVRGEISRSLSIRQSRSGGSIELQFTLQSSGYGSIVLVDLLGRIVRTVSKGDMEPGAQMLDVDISGLAAGPYLVRLTHQGVVQVGRFSR